MRSEMVSPMQTRRASTPLIREASVRVRGGTLDRGSATKNAGARCELPRMVHVKYPACQLLWRQRRRNELSVNQSAIAPRCMRNPRRGFHRDPEEVSDERS